MKPFLLLLCLTLSMGLHAQNLISDAKRLVEAKTALQEEGASDSTQMSAYANMLAILQRYDISYVDQIKPSKALLETPQHYSSNPLLGSWLPTNALSQNPNAWLRDTTFQRSLQAIGDSLQLAGREEMVRTMLGLRSANPADYLSVSKSLQEYSVPPVESRMYLKAAAQESNQNVEDGLLNAPVLIEGLFKFVLERAQQEIAISFMDRFLEKEVPPVKALFPTVFQQLSNTGFSYSHSYLDRIRLAFYEDLQLLSIRLPQLLLEDDRFTALQEKPIVYNLLTAYAIIGMAQNDLPAQDIMPLTHRTLYDNLLQNEKKRNFVLADNAVQAKGYPELVQVSKQLVKRISIIYDSLSIAENTLLDREESLRLRRMDSLFSASGPETRERLEKQPPLLEQLYKPDYQLGTIMGEAEAGEPQGYRLNFLPYLLQGGLDTSYLSGLRSVEDYDRYFGTNYSAQEYRAAGLEIARKLNGSWYNQQRLSDIFSSWLEDIIFAEQQIRNYRYTLFPNDKLTDYLETLNNRRSKLRRTILDTRSAWLAKRDLSNQEAAAFSVLDAIVKDTFDTESAALETDIMIGRYDNKADYLDAQASKLEQVEERLAELDERLSGNYNVKLEDNPITDYIEGSALQPHSKVRQEIQHLHQDLRRLKQKLDSLDTAYASTECRLIGNAEPLVFLSESLTQLMYCLRSGQPGSTWIDHEQLREAMANQELRPVILGLLYQRMRTVKQLQNISPDGLAQLVQLTVEDLPQIMPLPDSLQATDTLAFQRKATFVVNTLQRIVELPLLVNTQTTPSSVQPLSKVHPALEQVPSITGDVTDFIYYLNKKDHRQAISSLFELFADIQPLLRDTSDAKSENAANPILTFLNEYGTFVGGLVDARSRYEVQSLLNGIADPPGSSRLKRRRPFSLTLNSYVGASFGREWWSTASQTDEFYNVAPTLPIGVAFSFMTRKKLQPVFDEDGKLLNQVKRGASFSVFAGLLDLGSLFNYRFDSDSDFGNTELTFKNMFKPGVQVQYNFKNTPFYIGTGVQYGPHFQEQNGNVSSVQSTRLSISMGVDVPIKTLYVR
ncbi:MAG: hypothetical protein GVY26_13820 [Bacteroidetes bacterium]|jgi:hypothetical protein|nr:hypothetical protein [Bacteroidota bacterium]